MVTVAASDTIRYQNNPQINITTNQAYWNKTQTITITAAITGTARFSYGFGANSGCYASPDGCIGTQIRKGGTILGEWWPPDGVGSNVVDLAINFAVNDVIELWVMNGDGAFPTYTNNFHISYDLAGSASFTSSPSVARIWIDGIDKGVNTPNTISGLSAGSHNYTLKLAGYQDTSGSLSVTAGSTTTVPLVTFPASAYFTSTPTGATVWVDDTNLGTVTPVTVVGLTAGSHTYRLTKIGYTNRGNFSTTAGTTTNISATLTAVGLNGSIRIEDQYLCYINTSNVVTYVIGTSSGAVAGLPGSIWIEGTQLAYIDSSGNKRLLPVTTLGTVAGLDD